VNLSGKESNAQPTTLQQQVYERIKQDIITGTLAPGQLLNESELAKRLGVSKAPVRGALSQLQGDNLVESIPRKGHLVTTLTFRDIHDVFELRLILERAATRLAAERITDAEVSNLERYLEVNSDLNAPDSLYHFIRTNTDFHLEIAAASRNSRLVGHLAQVFHDAERLQYMDLHVSKERRGEWVHGHERLIEALRNRDKEAAAAIVESELANLLEYVQRR